MAVGGYSINKKKLDLCEMYEIATNNWTNLPKLNVSRSGHSACVLANVMVFVFCGRNTEDDAINKIEVFDMSNGR